MTTHPSPTLYALPRERVDDLPWDDLPAGVRVTTKLLYTCEGVNAGLLRMQPGARELTHQHVSGEHHLWVLSGTLRIDDTELPAGSYVHVPAHLQHSVEDGGTGSSAFFVFYPAD